MSTDNVAPFSQKDLEKTQRPQTKAGSLAALLMSVVPGSPGTITSERSSRQLTRAVT